MTDRVCLRPPNGAKGLSGRVGGGSREARPSAAVSDNGNVLYGHLVVMVVKCPYTVLARLIYRMIDGYLIAS